MYLLLLIAIIGLKTLLCKGLAIGIFLLAFWIKGRQLRFNSDEWDNFFLSLPAAKVQQYAIGIYLAAAVVSSVISYFILELAGGRQVVALAAGLALVCLAGAAYTMGAREASGSPEGESYHISTSSGGAGPETETETETESGKLTAAGSYDDIYACLEEYQEAYEENEPRMRFPS